MLGTSNNKMVMAIAVSAALATAAGCAQSGKTGARTAAQEQAAKQRPIALVYRGPAACQGCAEAAADMLKRQPQHFVITYIGPKERVHFSAKAFKSAALYVQAGGNDDLDGTWKVLEKDRNFKPSLIRDFIKSGGRYLGLCMGGYLAGSTDSGNGGFRILPGDSDEYVGSPGADVHTTKDTVVGLTWYGTGKPQYRKLYFQDGAYFKISRPKGVTVLARYRNAGKDKKIAIMIAPYGRGKVGVSGPHPEATPDWYKAYGLPNLYPADKDIGNKLIADLMK